MGYYQDKEIIVTGANRGIGLGLSRHLLQAGAKVWAGVRRPQEATELQALGPQFSGQLHIAALDVQKPDSIAAFTKPLANLPLDVLINNAGVNLDQGRSIHELPDEVLAQTLDANTIGPLRMVQSLHNSLHRAKQPVVANISSIMGSIADNASGGHVAYRVSKTATNMWTKCLALEDAHLIALTLHPGWVKTRMGGAHAAIDIDTAAAGLLAVISGAKPADSGKFFRYSGEEAPW